jgi:hypothetical protein
MVTLRLKSHLVLECTMEVVENMMQLHFETKYIKSKSQNDVV